jgi:hypothetical protein
MYGCSLDYHHPSSLLLAFSWFASLGGFWGLQELVGWLKKFVSTATINLRSGNKSLFVRLWRGRERESLVCVSFLSSL